MHPLGQHAGGGADAAHLIEVAAIYPLALLDDLGTHHLFGQRLEAVAQQLGATTHGRAHRIGFRQGGDGLGCLALDAIELGVALFLAEAELGQHAADVLGALLGQVIGDGGVLSWCLGNHLLNAEGLEGLFLVADQLADGLITEVDGLDHVLLRQLLGPGFHHHHPIGGAGHYKV